MNRQQSTSISGNHHPENQTISVASGAEALAVLERGESFDLLFTDVIMPGSMNGRELAEEVVKRRPASARRQTKYRLSPPNCLRAGAEMVASRALSSSAGW